MRCRIFSIHNDPCGKGTKNCAQIIQFVVYDTSISFFIQIVVKFLQVKYICVFPELIKFSSESISESKNRTPSAPQSHRKSSQMKN